MENLEKLLIIADIILFSIFLLFGVKVFASIINDKKNK
jgi:hypothetical protein